MSSAGSEYDPPALVREHRTGWLTIKVSEVVFFDFSRGLLLSVLRFTNLAKFSEGGFFGVKDQLHQFHQVSG